MTSNKRILINRLVRFTNAVESIEQQHAEALYADAGFDGGEFSGPAHARMAQKDADRAARRLGFANAELASEIAAGFRIF